MLTVDRKFISLDQPRAVLTKTAADRIQTRALESRSRLS